MQDVTRIPLEGILNTRDLGGYITKDGRKIKSNKLIRSGELYSLTEDDKSVLVNNFKLKKILDFRTKTETTERPDPTFGEVLYIHHPIMEESTLGITREKDGQKMGIIQAVLASMENKSPESKGYMQTLYSNFLVDDFSKNQYRKFFELLLKEEEGAVLWHCTAGKDRAGTAAILLLSALDVPKEQILIDYLKVNEFTKELIDLKEQEVLKETGSKEMAKKIKELFSAKESYFESIYDIIEHNYESMDDFLEIEMGLTAELREQLKEMYLE